MTNAERKRIVDRIIQHIVEEGQPSAGVKWAYRQIMGDTGIKKSELEKISSAVTSTGEYIRTKSEDDYYISKNPTYKPARWTEKHPIRYDILKGAITAIFAILVSLILGKAGYQENNRLYKQQEKRLDSLTVVIDSLTKK